MDRTALCLTSFPRGSRESIPHPSRTRAHSGMGGPSSYLCQIRLDFQPGMALDHVSAKFGILVAFIRFQVKHRRIMNAVPGKDFGNE